MQYVQSAITYTGSKRQYLMGIKKAFSQNHFRYFVDVFAGSFSVGINMDQSEYIICNDTSTPLIMLYERMTHTEYAIIENYLKEQVEKFQLDRRGNVTGFKALKEQYNQSPEEHIFSILLFAPLCFNGNLTFKGLNFKGNSGDKGFTEERFSIVQKFHAALLAKKDKLQFSSKPFDQLDYSRFSNQDLLYFDPPYLITDAFYNAHWGEQEEHKLYALLDRLDARGVRWVLSNVVEHNARKNFILEQWMSRHRVYPVHASYRSCVPRNCDIGESREVIVIN